MAVYDFFEKDGTRGGSLDDEFAREYDRIYIARCSSKFDQEPDIWAHPKCPQPYITISDWDRLSRCKSVHARHIKGTRWDWLVTAKFSSIQFRQPKADNPLQDPADVEPDTELVNEDRYTDRNGKPTCNTAGDLIKVSLDIPRLTFRITKNIALYNSWIGKIAGIINSSAVRIDGELYDAQTLKVTKARVSKVEYRNDIAFRVAQLEIRHKEETWQTEALNQGYNEIVEDWENVGKNGKPLLLKVRARQGFYGPKGPGGEPEPNPVFLDANGFRPREEYTKSTGELMKDPFTIGKKTLRGGVAKIVLDPSDIVLLKFDMLKLFDFNRLPLQ